MKKFMDYDFDIKKIVFVYHMDGGDGETVHKNRKNHGLAFFADGKSEYIFSDGTKIVAGSGEVIYLPKGSTYRVSTTVPGKCRAVNFELSSEVDFLPFSKTMKNPGAVMESFQRMKNVWEYKKSGYMARCKSELFSLIYTMQKEFHLDYLPKSKVDLIGDAVDYIHKNYCSNPLSISDLSKMCRISPEYFRKIFKTLYGVSPITYINTLKITRAKELLESGMYTATESAFLSGYNDLSVFSREFKKSTGLCPSEYAKKNNQLQ
ncbi:MAG: helix-turn-helix transcriptional regulator [Ruminococcaceae bacterium]|nr:helix-turn-helix transcriptional regulator [Oscillospiraceae bacterium]